MQIAASNAGRRGSERSSASTNVMSRPAAVAAWRAKPSASAEMSSPPGFELLPSRAVELRIATCRPLPEPDHDEDLLLEALLRAGVCPHMAAWHDPGEAWDEPIPTVIRSTWDYIHDVDRFVAWTKNVAGPLWNSATVIVANTHKRYLLDLAAAGIPVTPTVLVPHGSADLAAIGREHGWDDIVVKPAVGASSFGTLRCRADDPAGQNHIDDLLTRTDVLVQPYLRSVDGSGERALVWIDGEFTHAVRKTPRFSGGDEHVSDAVPIAVDERALAERVMAHLGDLLYARVDVARDESGAPLVMELELIEPSLFLLQHPPALSRLVDGIVRRLRYSAARL
jgi:hypothetical protein